MDERQMKRVLEGAPKGFMDAISRRCEGYLSAQAYRFLQVFGEWDRERWYPLVSQHSTIDLAGEVRCRMGVYEPVDLRLQIRDVRGLLGGGPTLRYWPHAAFGVWCMERFDIETQCIETLGSRLQDIVGTLVVHGRHEDAMKLARAIEELHSP